MFSAKANIKDTFNHKTISVMLIYSNLKLLGFFITNILYLSYSIIWKVIPVCKSATLFQIDRKFWWFSISLFFYLCLISIILVQRYFWLLSSLFGSAFSSLFPQKILGYLAGILIADPPRKKRRNLIWVYPPLTWDEVPV